MSWLIRPELKSNTRIRIATHTLTYAYARTHVYVCEPQLCEWPAGSSRKNEIHGDTYFFWAWWRVHKEKQEALLKRIVRYPMKRQGIQPYMLRGNEKLLFRTGMSSISTRCKWSAMENSAWLFNMVLKFRKIYNLAPQTTNRFMNNL
jgi:hypothetical protein